MVGILYNIAATSKLKNLDENGSQLKIGNVVEGDQGETASDGADASSGRQEMSDGVTEPGQTAAASPRCLHRQNTDEPKHTSLGQSVVDRRQQMTAHALERTAATDRSRQQRLEHDEEELARHSAAVDACLANKRDV